MELTRHLSLVLNASQGTDPVTVIKDTSPWGTMSPLVPSVVYFPPGQERPVVGSRAKSKIKSDPDNVIYNSKRFIGRDSADQAFTSEADSHGFNISSLPSRKLPFLSLLAFNPPNSGEPVTPEEVGTHVVNYLLDMCRAHLGYAVKNAVVAVPAKFTQHQREAASLSFKNAGLKVTRMLDEPTAAALAYGLHRIPTIHHILVYDFGGGTLDVSLLHVSDGYVEVVGTDGDDLLGGADFDDAIAEYLWSKMSPTVRVSPSALSKCPPPTSTPFCTHSDLFPLSEKLKISMTALSSTPRKKSSDPAVATQACMYIVDQDSCSTTTHNLTLSIAEYDKVTQPLLRRAVLPIRSLLSSLSLPASIIDEVVMVGGTSRIPQVRDVVKKETKKDKLNTHIDPDITVAYGCAQVID